MRLSVVDQCPVPAGSTAADALRNTIDLAQRAERLGYTRYWLAEHHATGTFACPAPEIMVGQVAAATSTIRVGSGGVLLPHYSPLKVAESFRVLHALYPGRIDLGIGRGLGGSPLDREGVGAFALQRQRKGEHPQDDIGEQLIELIAFLNEGFPPQHPFSRVLVTPRMPGAPDLWLLGSTGWSADAAAQLGLPYAAAHFIHPPETRRSIEHYFANFKPSPFLDAPQALVAPAVICADSQAEAERLYASQRYMRALSALPAPDPAENGPVPSPEDAIERLGRLQTPPRREESEWPRVFLGAPEQVRDGLEKMAAALKVHELMLITVVHDHRARVRSYELVADAFGLEPPSA